MQLSRRAALVSTQRYLQIKFALNCPSINFLTGTLLDLKTNDPNNPSTPGFLSGTFYDNSTVFPGTGYFSNCSGNRVARISLTSSNGIGAYSTCGSEGIFDSYFPKYFYAHPQLKWVTTINSSSAINVTGAIKVLTSSGKTQFVSRVNFTSGGQNYQQITYPTYYSSSVFCLDCGTKCGNNYTICTRIFEVLACTPRITDSTTLATTTIVTPKLEPPFLCGNYPLF